MYKKIYVPMKVKCVKKEIEKDAAAYIKNTYEKVMGRSLHLDPPVTYTEKIQWQKLYDDNPLYTLCADKVAVREYITKNFLGGGVKISFPKWYGIYSSPGEINFQLLPDQFVLKSNHASCQVIICNDRKKLNLRKTRRELNNWLKTNYYYESAEKQYKNIVPKIICEELLENNIIDYRIFCFNGEPYLIKVTQHNDSVPGGYDSATYYKDWTKADIVWNQDHGQLEMEKPDRLNDMLEIARLLSRQFRFVRVDLYDVEDRIYFSELTFTPNSGFVKDISYEWDKKLGDMFSVK